MPNSIAEQSSSSQPLSKRLWGVAPCRLRCLIRSVSAQTQSLNSRLALPQSFDFLNSAADRRVVSSVAVAFDYGHASVPESARQVHRNLRAPLTAGAQQIENRVDHIAILGCARPPPRAVLQARAGRAAPTLVGEVRGLVIVWHSPISRKPADSI